MVEFKASYWCDQAGGIRFEDGNARVVSVRRQGSLQQSAGVAWNDRNRKAASNRSNA